MAAFYAPALGCCRLLPPNTTSATGHPMPSNSACLAGIQTSNVISACSTSYAGCPTLYSSQRSQCKRIWCYPRAMAPDEEKMTRRSPLDFPIEWERPRPGRRPDIFPQFSPMKTPLPQPPPTDPPEEDEEEEEKKEEEETTPEEDPQPPKET